MRPRSNARSGHRLSRGKKLIKRISAAIHKTLYGPRLRFAALCLAAASVAVGIPSALADESFEAAAEIDSVDWMVRLLERRGDVAPDDEHSDAALLGMAVYHGSVEVTKLLLDRGEVDVNAGDLWLHHAVNGGNRNVVELLIAAGVSLRLTHWHGRTALHAAASKPSQEVLEVLLEHGADLEEADDFHWTPLHFALFGDPGDDRIDMALTLIARGAPVNAETLVVGWRPLHMAVSLGSPQVVAALLAQGAEVNAAMRLGGRTPLHLALGGVNGSEGDTEAQRIVAMLRKAGAIDRSAATPVRRVYFGRADAEAMPVPWVRPSGLGTTHWFYRRDMVRGAFTEAGADERLVSMSVGSGGWDATLFLDALIDKAGTVHFLWLSGSTSQFSLAGTCRDGETGRDHMIYWFSPDGTCCWPHHVYMYWDEASGGLKEGFDDYWHGTSLAEPGADGKCRWREAAAEVGQEGQNAD